MTYLIVGEINLINKEIDKILKENNINSNSIIKYDLSIKSLDDALIDLMTISLFDEKKCVICNNINTVEDTSSLKEYLENKNDNILIFTALSSKENKLIYDLYKKNNNIIDLSEIDLNKYVKENLKEYKISISDINILIDRCNRDFNKLSNELEKLKMYKYDEKEITKEDIEKLVTKNLDNNIFDLIDAINKNDKKRSLNIFNELIKNNEPSSKILVTLANNYRLIYQVKELANELADDEIVKLLEIKNPKRLYFLKKEAYNFTSNKLLKILKDLSDIDIAIKSGKINDKTAIELFLSRL